ncbi:MAG: S1/P1 Nuclease [Sphingobacteriales bacterium]|nr:S1/P1 Nuclease [Sphingobacteriales bacterium]
MSFVAGAIYWFSVPQAAQSWGFWAHKRINRLAVFTLPPEMIVFFKENIEYVTEHAADPDKRRYAVDGEAGKHFIDLDRYGVPPYNDLPHAWGAAKEKFSEDTLKAHGYLPWNLQWSLDRLTEAFVKKDVALIMRYSSDIGHYIADGHVPLHTTRNYNGQLTNQRGIHGFWESRVPELFGNDYDYFVGKAQYISDPAPLIWDFIMQSNAAVDSVLLIEAELNKAFPDDKKYSYVDRNNVMTRTYSSEYSEQYAQLLDNMQERRMRAAVLAVGSFWYTAWVNAGKPDLNNLGKYEESESEKEEMAELQKMYETGKIKGRSCDDH